MNDAARGTRQRCVFVEHQPAQVGGVQTVGILRRVDALQGGVLIEVPRQRQLHDVAGAVRVGVEFVDGLVETLLADVGGQVPSDRGDTDLGAIGVLAAHVGLRAGIVTDQDRAQARRCTARGQRGDPRGEVDEDLVAGELAVQDFCGHGYILHMNGAPDVFSPVKLGPIMLRNRIIKAATFEGRTPGALVTDDLIAFHQAIAAGGVGMTTIAYCAVSPGGRTDGKQMWMRPEALPGLRRLTEAVHAEGAAISAQIGHAGPVANAASNKARALAPVRFFNPIGMRFAKHASPQDIDEVIAAHAAAARLAIDAGFDAVEIHLGHNYLASSFLSPLINRRTDSFGGSLENRAKVARSIALAVRREVEKDGPATIAVTAKLNMADGVRGGISIEESLQTARWLQDDGGLDALELTAGSSLLNPMYLFRGDSPIKEFAAAFRPPLRWGMRMTGKKFLREYPYRDAFLMGDAERFRDELTIPLILLGGITNRETMDTAMAAGFSFVAMGRALLAEPDLINRIRADGDDHSVRSMCTHCNKCMPTIYTRTRCVVTGGP